MLWVLAERAMSKSVGTESVKVSDGGDDALAWSAVGDDVAGVVERDEEQPVTCFRARRREALEGIVLLAVTVERRDEVAGIEDRVGHHDHGIGADSGYGRTGVTFTTQPAS